MTTLQPKTAWSYCFRFWFSLRCHVYSCTSVFSRRLLLVFILLYEETKTVYLSPAHNDVLQNLPDSTGSMKSTAWRAEKQFVSTYSQIVLLLQFYSFPKGTKYVCVYVRVTDLLTKGGGLKTQNEARALYVCNRGLGDFWFIWLWNEAKAKTENLWPPRCGYFPLSQPFFVCFGEDWI